MTEKLNKKDLHTDPDRAMCLLDAAGYLPAPGETQEHFLERAEQEFFSCAKADFVAKSEEFKGAVQISDEILQDGGGRTEDLYGFRNGRVPGYFLGHGFGIFFGGCSATDMDTGETVIILRQEFAKRNHWFLYDRAELLAHEQCHATRAILKDDKYEEYFAYGTSKLRYRQYIGGCFNSERDTFLFFGGFLLLILADVAAFLGYMDYGTGKYALLVAILPALYLFIRNHLTWRKAKIAERHLNGIGISMAKACLFRATTAEIQGIARREGAELESYLAELREKELRWKIALMRFGQKS